jgi:hypothetical protein
MTLPGKSAAYIEGKINIGKLRIDGIALSAVDQMVNGRRFEVSGTTLTLTPVSIAVNVSPLDGESHVDVDTGLEWTPSIAYITVGYDVYFGTNATVTNNPKVVDGHNVTTYDPAALLADTTYYWRVDSYESGNPSPHLGDIWSFATGGKATNPVPDDGGIADRSLGQLSWQGDDFVSSYDVYFGFPGNLIFVDNVTVTSVTYGQLAAALSQTVLAGGDYQWKVNTKDSGGALMVEGDLWSVIITDPEPVVIDDFYGYADTAALLQVWSDGGTNGTGSTATCENLVGIAGLDYDNTSSPFKSEMIYSYQTPQSWLANAAESFEFSFRGVETNSTESLFVSITDGTNTATVECILSDPTTNPWWREYHIRLSDVTDQGVSLSNVTAFTIRVGDGTAGGTGQLYIDDVILGLSDCFDEYMTQADLNNDCKVDAADLRLLAEVWLLSDFTVSSVAPASGPVAHYSFEETSGTTVSDSSGNGHHATVTTASSVWQSGGYAGRCIEIDGTTEIALPASVFSSVTDELTVCLWLKGDPAEYSDSVDHVEFMAGDSTAHMTTWDLLRWDMTASADYGPDWVHYAVVKDVTAQTVQLFRNGILVGETENAVESISGISSDITTITALADSFNNLRTVESYRPAHRADLYGQGLVK